MENRIDTNDEQRARRHDAPMTTASRAVFCHLPRFAAIGACSLLAFSLSACSADSRTEDGRAPSAGALAHVDPILEGLSRTGTWERVAQPVRTTGAPLTDHVFDLSEAERAEIAEAAAHDPTWYAADGERYEALFVLEDGSAYGRRGPASDASLPAAANGYGASQAILGAQPVAGPQPALGAPGLQAQAVIAVDSSGDRRPLVSSTATLTAYPARTVGSMTGDGNILAGRCTGTKIGPRAILSAGHCVMDSAGNITFTGVFNPGQTNSSTPNGSISRSGLFLRDWRVDRRFDYSVEFLQDSAAVVSLGWMGVAWWDDASGYTGRESKNFGYPCGPATDCGFITTQTCKASPRADKRCDGWMYGGDSRTLGSNAFQSNELLQYDNDVSEGHSGSALFTTLSGSPAVMAVVTNGSVGQQAFGPRFRTSMWNDVCSWIANPSFQSAFGTHALCHP